MSSGQARNAIGSCTTDISGQPSLTYFDAPGRAELSRLILKSGKVKFTDTRIKYDDCPRTKIDQTKQGSKLCDQLPIYQRGDNIKLTNRRDIINRCADLAIPSTRDTALDRETDKIILDTCENIQRELYKCYHGTEISKTEAKRTIDITLRPYLDSLESKIPSYTGYIKIGDQIPSAADLAIFDIYTSTSPSLIDTNINLSRYPKLIALCKRIRDYSPVKEYCEERGY